MLLLALLLKLGTAKSSYICVGANLSLNRKNPPF